VAAAHVGRQPDFSYFSAYSNGGRQALTLAQRYPEDYDGIIAGAPALDFTSGYAAIADLQFNVLASADRHLSADLLGALNEAALAACDGTDGVKDGVIEEPDLCRFDPVVLACGDKAGERCLTAPQVATARRLYSGLKVPTASRPVTALPPGSETAWGSIHFGKEPGTAEFYPYVLGFMRGFVFEDPAWDPRSFGLPRYAALAEKKVAPVIDAVSPDLRRFVERGGKLILWHGWNDPLVSAYDTVEYHARVVDALGAESARTAVRLFMVPGVEHGRGGPGTDQFGQFAGGTGDPERSIAAAMQRWVERGIAPERVIAARAQDPKNPAVAPRTRPVCAWPLSARYKGTGSTDDAVNFDCVNVRR
jgi:feruloyl esterase